ncbi:MAG: nucleotidyltransferase family protein [Bacillota bacterium]|jgi:predicted nucleotidyltransferase
MKVFGSVVRGEETPDSDIDFLVDCKDRCSLFDLVALKGELENLLGRKVDVVSEKSIHWALKYKILNEAKEI